MAKKAKRSKAKQFGRKPMTLAKVNEVRDWLVHMNRHLNNAIELSKQVDGTKLDKSDHLFWALVKYAENFQECILQLDKINPTILPALDEIPEKANANTGFSWNGMKGMRQRLISFRKMPYTTMMRRRGRYGVPMQTYGSIIPGGPTLARLLPEGAQEGREEPRLSREAKARLRAVEWHKDHGEKVSLTARRFGRSRSTLYQWLECYRLQGPRGLQDRSHRPHQVRKPTWSLEFEAAVLRLRQDNPVWGKDKLQPILRRQGVTISVSMVGRILSRLRRQGKLGPASLKDPCIVSRPQVRPYAVRKPKDYVVKAPGDLVQVDSADVRWTGITHAYKHFSARDIVSRWDVLGVYGRATAGTARDFLDTVIERMPGPVKAIQVDGGSEFRAEFEAAYEQKGLRLFVLPPRSPKLNGCVERAQRTHKEELYQLVDPPDSLSQLRTQLLQQEQRYNTYRPDQALGHLTPQEWLLPFTERR